MGKKSGERCAEKEGYTIYSNTPMSIVFPSAGQHC